MSEQSDHERVRDLLNRIDEITRESERLRDQIESIRNTGPEWPDRRRASRLFDDRSPTSQSVPPVDTE